MTIDKIYSDGNLSVRSYHACKYNDIKTIVDLRSYFIKNKDFKKLRNCGKKTSLELISLCDKYQDISITEEIETTENNQISKIHNLNRYQRQVINQFIKNTTSNLNVRSRNAITSIIGKTPRLNNLLNCIFGNNNFQVSTLKNIGRKNIPELELYLDNIKAFINEVSNIKNENELVGLNNKYLIQNIFSITNIPNRISQSQSIIKLCEFLILENAFFKTYYNTIFINTLNVFNSKYNTLDEIALLTKVTRERVRQIRQKCFSEIPNKIAILKNFEDDLYQNYELDINVEFIIISDEKANEINFLYDTHFSKNFLSYIFSIYLSDQFTIIGNIEDGLIPKQFNARNRHNWKNIYLINNELKDLVNIDELIEDISVRKQERINETYKFNFKSYLSRFLKTDNFRILENIKDDCEKIINEEFNFFLDLDENIVFQRNTLRTAAEYSFEALDKLGKPSKVEEIYFKIIDLFPDFKTDIDKVRASLKRKDGFVPIGRKSIYGLQKWENEHNNFKGGTIRRIVKEYLDKLDRPKHITDITKYVLQYRPKTNERSILQNLKLDESKIFNFFNNSHIGVTGKKYDDSHIAINLKMIPQKKTWAERYDILKEFIQENNRLPSVNSANEEALYNWFYTQKSKNNHNKLDHNKEYLINQILEQFPNRRISLPYKYENLLKFVKKNKRLPSAKYDKEKSLYRFFNKQRNLWEKNELDDESKTLFITIAKEIQNTEYEDTRN